jgi:hypothetical protein
MSISVDKDYLVVKMKAEDMTSRVMRAGCGDTLHLLGWAWTVVSTDWYGINETLTKTITLRREDSPISAIEAIHTNCYPVRFSIESYEKEKNKND